MESNSSLSIRNSSLGGGGAIQNLTGGAGGGLLIGVLSRESLTKGTEPRPFAFGARGNGLF